MRRRQIKERLTAFAAEKHEVPAEQVVFLPNRVRSATRRSPSAIWSSRPTWRASQLSAAGFLQDAQDSLGDRDAGAGRPYLLLRLWRGLPEGLHRHADRRIYRDRVDILHETGSLADIRADRQSARSRAVLSRAWALAGPTEELVWDAKGRLRTSTRPVDLQDPARLRPPRKSSTSRSPTGWRMARRTVHKSKAVGEPPFMLGMAVLHALSDAVASVADHRYLPSASTPRRRPNAC